MIDQIENYKKMVKPLYDAGRWKLRRTKQDKEMAGVLYVPIEPLGLKGAPVCLAFGICCDGGCELAGITEGWPGYLFGIGGGRGGPLKYCTAIMNYRADNPMNMYIDQRTIKQFRAGCCPPVFWTEQTEGEGSPD